MTDEERKRKFEHEEKMRCTRLLLDMYEKYGSRIMGEHQETSEKDKSDQED